MGELNRGEWIPYECEDLYGYKETDWYKCSACGADALGRCYEDEYYSYPYRTQYCPNCGAKMDGEKYRTKSNGVWIINPDGYYPYCSECGYEPIRPLGNDDNRTPHCPNCGAKMRKECER